MVTQFDLLWKIRTRFGETKFNLTIVIKSGDFGSVLGDSPIDFTD